MKRWLAIEGLRAWLAWTVALAHCVQMSGLGQSGPLWFVYHAAAPAVLVFIIISGFVITHLLLERHEPYFVYIVRRFMRLYPLFIATCILGFFLLPWLHDAQQSSITDGNVYDAIVASQVRLPTQHLFSHALMLHGTVPDQILPMAALTLSVQAWSISLEWQFYLIAPLVIFFIKTSRGAAILLALCGAGAFLFYRNKLGSFLMPSFLPGAAPLFAVGIASRLIWPMLRERVPNAGLWVMGAFCLTPLSNADGVAVLFWFAFFALLCADKRLLTGIDKRILRLRDVAFEHPYAIFWGARSYSVYLCHFFAIGVLQYLFANFSHQFFLTTFSAIITTAFVSILTYHFIERPGIRLGRLLADKLSTVSAIRPCGRI